MDVIGGHVVGTGAERYHRREFVFRIFTDSSEAIVLRIRGRSLEGRSPFGRILVPFHVAKLAKLAPVGLQSKSWCIFPYR